MKQGTKTKSGQFTYNSVGDVHTIKLEDKEGIESMMLLTDQLYDLLDFLNSLQLPERDKSIEI